MRITNKTVSRGIRRVGSSVLISIGVVYPVIHYLFEEDTKFFGTDTLFPTWRLIAMVGCGIILLYATIIFYFAMEQGLIEFEHEIELPWSRNKK
jgi:hypothetical protein